MRLFVCVAALMLSACHDPTSPAESAWAAARARWNTNKPASNRYVFQQVRHCFCLDGGVPNQVTVVGGVITNVRNLQTNSDRPVAERAWFRTIDELFDDVRDALKSPGMLTAIDYDPVLGYPTTAAFDPIRNAADDEHGYGSSNVVFAK